MLRFCGSLWFLNNFEPVFVHLDLIRHEASKEYYVAGRFLMVTAVMIGLLWLSMVVPPLLDGSPAGNGLLDGNGSAGVFNPTDDGFVGKTGSDGLGWCLRCACHLYHSVNCLVGRDSRRWNASKNQEVKTGWSSLAWLSSITCLEQNVFTRVLVRLIS